MTTLPEEAQQQLLTLCAQLNEAKQEENKAKQTRILHEQKIVALIGSHVELPAEGQMTVAIGDVKITVEQGFNYKVDRPALNKALENTGKHVPIKASTSYSLDKQGYKWYQANDHETYATIAKHVTATPKKTSVAVK
jgi:hypothetical protein